MQNNLPRLLYIYKVCKIASQKLTRRIINIPKQDKDALSKTFSSHNYKRIKQELIRPYEM